MSVTLSADYKQGDWVPATNPCPVCGEAGGMGVRERLVARPIGSFSLAGAQMKVSANWRWEYRCSLCDACGEAEPKKPRSGGGEQS